MQARFQELVEASTAVLEMSKLQKDQRPAGEFDERLVAVVVEIEMELDWQSGTLTAVHLHM